MDWVITDGYRLIKCWHQGLAARGWLPGERIYAIPVSAALPQEQTPVVYGACSANLNVQQLYFSKNSLFIVRGRLSLDGWLPVKSIKCASFLAIATTYFWSVRYVETLMCQWHHCPSSPLWQTLTQKQQSFPRTPISSPINLHFCGATGSQNREYKRYSTKLPWVNAV